MTALLVLAACSSPPASSESVTTSSAPVSTVAPSPTPDTTEIDAAASILEAAKLTDAASLGALQGIRFTEAGTAAAASLLESGATGDTLWAATYVYATSGEDLAPLRPIADSTTVSPSIRAMAAAGLLGRGEVSGFDPLIAALGGSESMQGSAPPGDLWEFAADVLARYTSTGFGPTLSTAEVDRAGIQAQWKAWLDAHRTTLHFDPASQRWAT